MKVIFGELLSFTLVHIDSFHQKLLISLRTILKGHTKSDHVEGHEDVSGQGTEGPKSSLIGATAFIVHTYHVAINVLTDNKCLQSF